MVSNLEKERSERIQEITLLKEQIASQEGDSTLLNATLSRLQKELAEVNDKLADKHSDWGVPGYIHSFEPLIGFCPAAYLYCHDRAGHEKKSNDRRRTERRGHGIVGIFPAL